MAHIRGYLIRNEQILYVKREVYVKILLTYHATYRRMGSLLADFDYGPHPDLLAIFDKMQQCTHCKLEVRH